MMLLNKMDTGHGGKVVLLMYYETSMIQRQIGFIEIWLVIDH